MKKNYNIEIIIVCLYIKDYISLNSFMNYFILTYEYYENIIPSDLFMDLMSLDTINKADRISLLNKLTAFTSSCYSDVYEMVNDSFVETIIEEENQYDIPSEILSELRKKYEQVEMVEINCDEIETEYELICKLQLALRFPIYWGKNWDATFDYISDFIPPKKLIINNIHSIKVKEPNAVNLFLYAVSLIDTKQCKVEFIPPSNKK